MNFNHRRLNPSIRTQLLAWLVIPILVLLLVGASLTYGYAMNLATDAYDKALLDTVYSVAGCVQVKQGKAIVDIPPAALAILKEDIKDNVYYQVLDEHHRIISGDANLPLPDFDSDDADDNRSADYRDGRIDGQDIRIASVKFPVPSHEKLMLYIQVAETVHGREQIANKILIGYIVLQLVMVTMSSLVVFFGVKRGLKTLNSLRDAVASRTPVDLGPIAVESVPKEVQPLVRALNELLEQLKGDLDSQRRFVANAAHQLRTPIAGLKMQSELALRQSDPEDVRHALSLIRTGAERAARLANQLLALARAEPGAVDPKLWQLIDLNNIAKGATTEFVPDAIANNIDLGFEGSEKPVYVLGDQASLHELAANLVDNAVRYTPEGGRVTARITNSRSVAELIIEDNGPGIPAEERDRVFERFYRLLDRNVSGSGLGLAIVREIANLHKATIALSEGPGGVGARVTIQFPVAQALEFSPNGGDVGKGEHNLVVPLQGTINV